MKLHATHQLGPRYEGQLMSHGGAYSPFRSILLVLTHDAGCAPFSLPFEAKGVLYAWGLVQAANVPLHELPPARLVLHRQTSAHERRKGRGKVQLRSGILAYLCTRHHWLWITVELHIPTRATRRLMLGREVATLLYAEFREYQAPSVAV